MERKYRQCLAAGALLLGGCLQRAVGQTADTMEAVVVSATKFAVCQHKLAQQILVIPASYISRVNAQHTGDLLAGTGSIFVQKSQQGGASPVIRGFEASRVLLVVDGVRMNNAIYRAGHLQNVMTVDQNMLEKVEVLYGPASTLYGSDALGGAIHLLTKGVALRGEGKGVLTRGNGLLRYSTANQERTAHVDVNVGFKHAGFLAAVTVSDFGDMKMGSRYPKEYPGFGRRSWYVQPNRRLLADAVVHHADDRVQRYSGYRQWDILQKVLLRQGSRVVHALNLQWSNSTDIPRYDRLQDMRNGAPRYAEWYYGPQKRNLLAYTFQASRLKGLFQELRATWSYQHIRESRQTRELNRYDRFDSRREEVTVWGLVIDLRKQAGRHEWTLGADAQWNKVRSVADRTNLATGAVSALDSRYPNGKNRMNYAGIYFRHTYTLREGKWVLHDGWRLQAVQLRSTIADNSFFNLPVTDIRQRPAAITGHAGIVHTPSGRTKFSLNLSSGFRAPNIDDLARIFESASALQQVVVPNTSLQPEYTYGADACLIQTLPGKVKLEVSLFYTLFSNGVALAPFTLNGQDSILYHGVLCRVMANQNHRQAYLCGGSLVLTAALGGGFSVFNTISYTRGRFKTGGQTPAAVYRRQPDGSYALVQALVKEIPMDHIPPVFGRSAIGYHRGKWYAEGFIQYNGWKRLEAYNPDGEDNAPYATAAGMPAWMTLNGRTGFTVNSHLVLQWSVENILDRNYRYFASGFSAPGRHFLFAIRGSF